MSQTRPTRIPAPEPGLYPGVPFALYAAWAAVNSSLLKEVAESPHHGRYSLTAPDADTYSRKALRATHCLALEGREAFEREYVIWDGRRQGSDWTDFKAKHEDRGVTIITAAEAALVEARAAAIARHAVAGPLLRHRAPGRGTAYAEACVVWVDENTGLTCKGRIDFLILHTVNGQRTATAIDLKTWDSTAPRRVSTEVARQKVHLQMAHYVAGLRAVLGGAGVDIFDPLLIVVEGSKSHDVGVYAFHDPAEEGEEPQPGNRGGEKARRVALDTWAECLRTGHYPGRCPDVDRVVLPRWAVGAEEEGTLVDTFNPDPLGDIDG